MKGFLDTYYIGHMEITTLEIFKLEVYKGSHPT